MLLFQSGPFMAITVPGADPSGTGFATLIGNGRADVVTGVAPYPATPDLERVVEPGRLCGTCPQHWPIRGMHRLETSWGRAHKPFPCRS